MRDRGPFELFELFDEEDESHGSEPQRPVFSDIPRIRPGTSEVIWRCHRYSHRRDQRIRHAWGQTTTRKPPGFDEEPCYVIRCDLAPKHICGHSHPTRISDPHGGGDYINERFNCDMCHDNSTVGS